MKKYLILIGLLVVINFSLLAQNQKEIDSLTHQYSLCKTDTTKVQLLNQIAKNYWFINPDTAITLSSKALKIAKKNNYPKGEAACYNSIGACNLIRSNLPVALENFLKALSIGKSINDKSIMALQYQNIGVVYFDMKNFDDALYYYEKALEIAKLKNYKTRIMANLQNIAGIYNEQKLYEKSIEYNLKSLSYFSENDSSYEYASVLVNISTNYMELINDTLSKKYADKALKIANRINSNRIFSHASFNLGWYYYKNGETKKGIEFYEKALDFSKKSGNLFGTATIANELANKYHEQNNYIKAYEYLSYSTHLNDSILNIEKNKEINGLQLKYERQQTEKEKIIANEKALKKNIILLSISIISVLLLFIMVFIYNRLKITRKQKSIIEKQNIILIEKNEEITTQNEEITTQNNVIQKQHENIQASISYASKIQQAILPSKKMVEQHFEEHFVLYRPCHVVSGDFYWFRQIKNHLYICAADCTGHGVPGAFMSMLGVSLLNQIVNDTISPNIVLNELRNQIKNALNQTGKKGEQQDGMDIALCMIDLESKKVQFAGAYNPMYLIRNNELIEFKADKMPIGIHPKDSNKFTNHEIQLENGDTFYLFSDGYVSQFGGEKDEKFKTKRFTEILTRISDKSMKEQHDILDKTIDDWRGNQHQTDDICVIGINVNTITQ